MPRLRVVRMTRGGGHCVSCLHPVRLCVCVPLCARVCDHVPCVAWQMEELDDARSTASESTIDSYDEEVDRLGAGYKRFQYLPPSVERVRMRRGVAPHLCRVACASVVVGGGSRGM